MTATTPQHNSLTAAAVYIPRDWRELLTADAPLPALPIKATGAVLFADISGFTPLTDALVRTYGKQRGAEELVAHLNRIYDALISEVHRCDGSVIGFSGDAITCWLPADDGQRAIACGLAMQDAMQQFAAIALQGDTYQLAIKVLVGAGDVRRFLVGDPDIQLIDVLAGEPLERVAACDKAVNRGEVMVEPYTAAALADTLRVREWRSITRDMPPAAIVAGQHTPPPLPATAPFPTAVPRDEVIASWLLPAVAHRLQSGHGSFLADMRPVTALFLRFSGIDYHEDAAAQQLDAYIRHVQHVLARYEAALIQVTVGDKGSYLYAAFGAPVAHDDDGLRSVDAAHALINDTAHFPAITEVQIGLSRGQMCAGAYGSTTRRLTYGVLGDETNVAARLMSLAQPGQVLTTARISEATCHRYRYDDLGDVQVKGKSKPIAIARLRHARTLPDTTPPSLRAVLPMVGRDLEYAIAAAHTAALTGGRGGVLLIEGEAGMGKSRLLADVRSALVQQGLVVLSGAGQSIEQQTQYRAWRDILAGLAGIDERDDLSRRRQRVLHLIRTDAPDEQPRAPLLNDILDLAIPPTRLSNTLDPALRQQNLTLLLAKLLGSRAHCSPVALVIEDAHWLDDLSWAVLVNGVLPLIRKGTPLLLLLVMRPVSPGSTAAQSVAQIRQNSATTIQVLGELTASDVVQLAAQRLGIAATELPEAVQAVVRERAAGNPFVAEELILYLRDQGVLALNVNSDGVPTCAVVGDLAATVGDLPETVQGLILSRLDRLDPALQLPLKVGAVIGQQFGYGILRDTVQRYENDLRDDRLRHSLDQLTNLQLTVRQQDGSTDTAAPALIELNYAFKHIITQEVTYQTLLHAQRRELHRSVAQWYEKTFHTANDGEPSPLAPYYPLLVHHYHHAEDTAQECYYARLAGLQAAASYANESARGYLTRALELTPAEDAAARFDLLAAREQVYALQGARSAQFADLQALAALAEATANSQWQATVAQRRANYHDSIGDYPAAISDARAAIAVATSDGNSQALAQGYQQWGVALWRQGRYALAASQLRKALEVATTTNLPALQVQLHRLLGNVKLAESSKRSRPRRTDLTRALFGDDEAADEAAAPAATDHAAVAPKTPLEEARAAYSIARDLARELDDPIAESAAQNNLGVLYHDTQDYTAARACYRSAFQLAQDLGDQPGQARTLMNMAALDAATGNSNAAIETYQQALNLHRLTNSRIGEALALAELATLYAARGDTAARDTATAKVRDLVPEIARHTFITVTDNADGTVRLILSWDYRLR